MSDLGARVVGVLAAAIIAFGSVVGPAPAVAEAPSPSAAPPAAPATTPAPVADPVASPPADPVASPAATAPAPTAAPAATPAPVDSAGLRAGATEITSARTEYAQTYDNHDGTLTTQFFASPVFYKPDGASAYVPIEVGFAAASGKGGPFVSDRAPVAVTVNTTSATGAFLSSSYGDRTISFRMPAAAAKTAGSVTPVVAGAVADYTDLVPGVGLRVIANAHGAKSFFVWRTAPADPSISYVVDAPGLVLAPQDDGSIALQDADGTAVARIPTPYAVDSTADERAGSGRFTDAVRLALGADGRTVTVSVDPTWLETAVYPVYVDPSTGWVYNTGTNTYGDAHVASGYPTHNYDDYQRPDSPYYHELWNGTDPSGIAGTTHDYLKWSLSTIANVTVDSASLRLYPYHQYYNSPTAETTYVRRLTEPWYETTVTWDTRPTYTSTGYDSAGCVEAELCVWDVRAIVQEWLKGVSPASNYGFQVDTIGKGSTFWKRFIASEQGGGSRPALSITYHNPTVTSTTSAYTGTVAWTYADSGGAAQAKYRVDVAATQAGLGTANLATSGDVAGPASAWTVVPTAPGTMTDGTSYWYQVRAYNGTSWTAWAQGQFTYDAYRRGAEAFHTAVPFDLGGGWNLDVAVHSGEARLTRSLFSIPSYGPEQSLALSYSSLNTGAAGTLGYGWSSNLTQTIAFPSASLAIWTRTDGGRVAFAFDGSTWAAVPGHYAALAFNAGANEYVITLPDHGRVVFDHANGDRLKRIENRFGKALTLTYTGAALSGARDASNRATTIAVTAGFVTAVSDSAGRTWTLGYTGSDLTSITGPDPDDLVPWGGTNGPLPASVSTLGYDASHRLTTITRNRADVPAGIAWTIGFDTAGRAASVKDPILVHPDLFTYATGTTTYQEVTVDGTTPDYATTTYTLDAYGRATTIADGLVTTARTFDAGFNLTSEQTPADGTGAKTSWAYDPATGNRLSQRTRLTMGPETYVDTVWTYSTTNDVTSQTDADNIDATRTVTRFEYTGGHLSKEVRNCTSTGTAIPGQGAGGACTGLGDQTATTNLITSYTYTANDQLDRETDPLGRVTRHAYDPDGNETAVIANCVAGTTPCDTATRAATPAADANVFTTSAYDASPAGRAGLPTSTTDPLGRTTTLAYDVLGRLITETLPADASIPALVRATAFDTFGNVLSETESWTPIEAGGPSTRTTVHVYDLVNRETSVTDPWGTVTVTDYDDAGNTDSTTAGAGTPASVTTSATFDLRHRLATQTRAGTPSGTWTVSAYTPLDAPATVLTPGGRSTTTSYRLDGAALSVTTTPAGGGTATVTTTTYDALGRELTSDDEDADTTADTTNVYDRLGRLTSTTVNGATTAYEYDRAGNQVRVTDPAGIVTTTGYDALGRATTVIANDVATRTQPTEDITTTTFYDAAGNAIAVRDPRGATTRTIVNARDLALDVIANCTDTGTLTPSTDPPACTGGTLTTTANVRTRTTYDGAGNAVKVTTAVGLGSAYEATTRSAYDAADRAQATQDPRGTVTRSVYNAAGQLTDTWVNCTDDTSSPQPPPTASFWTCDGSSLADGTFNIHTVFTYDAHGNQASVRQPNGRLTTSAYDAEDRLVTTIDNYVNGVAETADGVTDDITTTYGYDGHGRQASVRAPTADGLSAAVTRTVYNADGTVASVIANCTSSGSTVPSVAEAPACTGAGTSDAQTNIVTASLYDTRGNVVAGTAPSPTGTGTTTTQYAYDDANRLCRVVENATGSTNLQTLADPCSTATQDAGTATANVSTRYGYDGAGNLASMTDASGHATTYGFDEAGHMTGRTDALGATLAWTYDALGNRTTQRNRTDPIPTYSVTWTHDPAGRILTRTADSVTTTYTYDLNGSRLTATAGSQAITAAYDRLGRVLTVDDEDAGTTADTSYTYSITSPTWTDPTGTYAASLDAFDRATALTDPASPAGFTWTYGTRGEVLASTQGNGNVQAQAFDAAGRLLTRTTTDGGVSRAAYTYTYNRAGLVLSEASTITGDPSNGTVAHTYDPLGQLTGSTLAGTTTAYGWDATTNRTSVTVGGGTPATTAYDAANRPTSGASPTAAYASDADGRLTARPDQTMTWDRLGRLTSVRNAAGTVTIASYTYDPLDRLRMVDYGSGSRIRFRYLALTTSAVQTIDDATGTVIRSIGTGWGGELLLDWTGTGQDIRIYGTNAHHDITWTATSTGTVAGSVRYDPWGTATTTTNPGSLPDFRFQSSWADPVTSLSWVVTRWYAPALGRFISEDTLLGEPRDPDSRHLYAYAAGDPVGAWDPDGRLANPEAPRWTLLGRRYLDVRGEFNDYGVGGNLLCLAADGIPYVGKVCDWGMSLLAFARDIDRVKFTRAYMYLTYSSTFPGLGVKITMRFVTYVTQYDYEGGQVAPLRVQDPYVAEYTELRFPNAARAGWADCRRVGTNDLRASCWTMASGLFRDFDIGGRVLTRTVYGCWPDYVTTYLCRGQWSVPGL